LASHRSALLTDLISANPASGSSAADATTVAPVSQITPLLQTPPPGGGLIGGIEAFLKQLLGLQFGGGGSGRGGGGVGGGDTGSGG
jgi:hypothetical protein